MTRSEAKRQYAMSILKGTGNKGVCVLPVFIEEVPGSGVWTPMDTVVIEGSNEDWCAVNVMSVQSSYNEQGFENERVMSALIRRKTVGTDDKYKPGQVLSGKIAIMETLVPTDASDETRDIKAPSAEHAEAGIYCTVNDQPIYQRKYYTDDLTKADITIAHDNIDAIAQFRATLKLKNGNAAGMATAAAKAKELADLKAIPAAKRTAEQKARMLELV